MDMEISVLGSDSRKDCVTVERRGDSMDPKSIYESEEQKNQHLRAIQILVKEIEKPGDEISRLYHLVLEEYEKEAKVKIFLPILISKRVREMIKKTS